MRAKSILKSILQLHMHDYKNSFNSWNLFDSKEYTLSLLLPSHSKLIEQMTDSWNIFCFQKGINFKEFYLFKENWLFHLLKRAYVILQP